MSRPVTLGPLPSSRLDASTGGARGGLADAQVKQAAASYLADPATLQAAIVFAEALASA